MIRWRGLHLTVQSIIFLVKAKVYPEQHSTCLWVLAIIDTVVEQVVAS